MFEFSHKELRKILEDFYNLTKFKIVLYDSDRNVIASYPDGMCRFCTEVRKSPVLYEKCIGCDNVGFDICDKTRAAYIYKCHMSVIEAIAPIYSNEITIGYLMFGQILEKSHEEVIRKATEISKNHGIYLTDDMISEMTVADGEYIKSAVNMMTMCANYLYTNEIIRNNPNVLAYQIKEYIKSHLTSDLSLDALCKRFYVSRTKLYQISSSNFGMGITDYIRLCRIREAKRLLSTTESSVSEIASTVGISDTNYFIRAFKQSEGITPLQYRKQLK